MYKIVNIRKHKMRKPYVSVHKDRIYIPDSTLKKCCIVLDVKKYAQILIDSDEGYICICLCGKFDEDSRSITKVECGGTIGMSIGSWPDEVHAQQYQIDESRSAVGSIVFKYKEVKHVAQ